MPPNNLGSDTLVLCATPHNGTSRRNPNRTNIVNVTPISSTEERVSVEWAEAKAKKNKKKFNKMRKSNIIHFIRSDFMQRQPYFQFKFKDIVWRNVIIFLYLHAAAMYGIYLVLAGEAYLLTFVMGKIWFLGNVKHVTNY